MLTAEQVLDAYFLDNRCMLLEIAATLDRLDAARERGRAATVAGDPRLQKIYKSLAILADENSAADRTERLLRLFSDPVE